MKQPKYDLLERLEGAAQACHAAHILSCEATCREAAEEIARLRKLVPSESLEEVHQAFDAWLKKTDPLNLFVTCHGFAREAWQDARLLAPSERKESLSPCDDKFECIDRDQCEEAGECLYAMGVLKNAAPQVPEVREAPGNRPMANSPAAAAQDWQFDKQETLLERAIRRLHDNIARREATEDVEALKAVLLEMASQKERGDRWQKISDQRAIEVADLKRDLSKALANHSADLSATLSIPKPEVAVPVGGKSIQLSYFGDGEREAALEAFKRWLG